MIAAAIDYGCWFAITIFAAFFAVACLLRHDACRYVMLAARL